MDRKQRRTTDSTSSDSEEGEDPVETLTGMVSKLRLPTSGATSSKQPARGRVDHKRSERSFADSKKAGTEDGLCFDPADYPEEEEQARMFEKFLETSAPSKVKRPTSAATSSKQPARGRVEHKRSERSFADSKKAGTEDGLCFDPADYPEEEEQARMFEKFLETSAPSKVKRSDGIGWIRVLSSSFKDDLEGLGDLEGLESDWQKLQKSKKTINFEAIKTLAVSNHCLGGIWLLFFDTGVPIDNAWEKISKATVKDELGTHAKVTPREDKGEGKDLHEAEHVISVYTKDFTDKEDVLKIEGALRGLGFRERFVFKPRVYSSLGVYSQNKWRLRPGIYTSQWDAVKQAGRVRDSTKPRETYMINYQSSKE